MSGQTYLVKDQASGREFELQARSGTVGPDVVDIRSLYGQHGLFTYDPGCLAVAGTGSGPCSRADALL